MAFKGHIMFGLVNPTDDHEKSSVTYCSSKNHNFAEICHTNLKDASF